LDDYALVNLHAGYEVNENLSLKVRVENALDDDYETAFGFGTPGRAAYIGVTSSF
jgi:vitamin B12 transporter